MEVGDPGSPPWADPVLTDEQVEQLRAEWLRKMQKRGKIKILNPPPWRTRLRLAFQQAVTDGGIWLCDHRMWWAADLLWWRR